MLEATAIFVAAFVGDDETIAGGDVSVAVGLFAAEFPPPHPPMLNPARIARHHDLVDFLIIFTPSLFGIPYFL
jgi:hypothetical protein